MSYLRVFHLSFQQNIYELLKYKHEICQQKENAKVYKSVVQFSDSLADRQQLTVFRFRPQDSNLLPPPPAVLLRIAPEVVNDSNLFWFRGISKI